MAQYADIFVVPVPVEAVDLYRQQAETFVKVWLENGALSCVELEADDVPAGELTSFPQSVQLKPDEKVFVGMATYQSREQRDQVNARAMQDPRMSGLPASFDGKRMFFGGFKSFVGD
ncbi:uncharacterized protein YbaA (DUF1428 family) [Rhodoblastus acidophilus]|uniref:DUF1428 domain-containing protein n=1 Tax=Rhodoblastus acidophilus TaxID=1074 RepID=UPI002224BEC6|nr:DUF1428 domain-containing protein [Rhodoblastus acidophilus]MCW2316814.1 uncharacterized protein YbaA (DUF1428 family) [Rhodoblastus acidophilus]